jgi:CrcB protein
VIERSLPYLLVGLGSFVGGNARFVFARWMAGVVDTRFPLGIFLVNVSGSFLLGLIGGFLAQRSLSHPDAVRLALGVGFCGGFTTFSTFELDTHGLLEDGLWLTASMNMVLSLLVGLLAVRGGVIAARALA